MGASITAELGLNTTPFAAAFSRVRGILSGAGSRFAAILPAVMGASAAAFASVAAGAYGVKRAMDLGGQLTDLSNQTGEAAGELLVLQQAFQNNGMAAEDVGGSINRMQKKIAEGSEIFGRLGVDLAELKSKNPSAQLRTVGEAINNINDPTERAAAAMEIFGKSGAKMLGLFGDSGAMDQAAKEVGTQAEILNRNAGLFDDVGDKLALTGRKTMGFFVGVADKVVPVIAPLLDRFAAIDLAKYGQAIGDGIAFVVQAIADGKLGTILFTSAKIAFANAVNFLNGGVVAVGRGLWQVISEAVKNAITVFQIVTTSDFWAGMGKGVLGIAQAFVAFILDGIAKMLRKLSEIPLIGESIGDGAREIERLAGTVRGIGQDTRGNAADLLAPALNKAENRMRDAFGNVSESIAEGFARGQELIDTSGSQRTLDRLVDEVSRSAEKAGESARAAVKDKPRTGFLDDEERKASTGVADADRRVGLGGFAGGGVDPMLRAQQDTRRALEANTAATRALTEKLKSPPPTQPVVVPVFR